MSYKDPIKQREYQRNWRKKKRLLYKRKAIEALGGKCCECGFNDERCLQFDHIIPVLRDGGRGENTNDKIIYGFASGKEDLGNIQLLCANCHAIKTVVDRESFRYNRKD